MIRDQIISGTNINSIRDEGLKKQWKLDDLIKEGRTIESGAIAALEIKRDNANIDPSVNRVTYNTTLNKPKNKFLCFKCEEESCPGFNKCKFRNKRCSVCGGRGHSIKTQFCKGAKSSTNEKKKPRKKKKKKVTNHAEAISSDVSSETDEFSSASDDH